ncbi:MAG TPA: carboxymethylenebutenolidase, partial [Gammaproteobacteria bacterium]|nr:carboxymethylenebutenolidase [Gammaproteobacteria bacterium]
MKTETVNYQATDVGLEGYVAFPDTGSAPLVLIAHTWAGKDEFVHQKAEDLAALGYVGFAVDMYGNGKVG